MESALTAVVVDDNVQSRAEVTRALALAGVTISVTSGTSVEAFRTIVASEPSLVFVTLEDPLPRAIRAIEYLSGSLPDATVVAVSSSTALAVFQ
ncbi:MAG: hypothetical protein ABIP13_06250, partial [Tepidiformaceae bacterium]